MQLFALDASTQQLVTAAHAKKQYDYACIECGATVRARGGLHHQKHFYHLQQRNHCRQNGKSLAHLQVQLYLQKILPKGQCHLEKRFPTIQRVADVVWEEKSLIFEVQCSPIRSEEIQARNRDYRGLGYHVVWIFHERTFNQSLISAAELSLMDLPRLFTNIDAQGNGLLYDQLELITNRQRKRLHISTSVDPSKLAPLPSTLNALPPLIQQRKQKWPFYFQGDLLDYCLSQSDLSFAYPPLHTEKNKRNLLLPFIRFYTRLLYYFLEKACR